MERNKEYRELLIKGGCSEAEADETIAYQDSIARACDELKCMNCSGTLSRKIDGRQAGGDKEDKEKGMLWVNYRCAPDCDFMVDRMEDAGGDLH